MANGLSTNQQMQDSTFTIVDDGDNTKALAFQASGISTATTRTATMPDASGTMTLLGNASTGSGSVVLAASPTLTGTVTVPTPVNGTDASTKAYVDSIAAGLSIKASCQEATTAALPANVYNNGASGVGATLTAVSLGVLTVDGIATALGDRILVKNEVAQANNGIYSVTTAGAAGVLYVLTRTTDSNTGAEILGGFTFIEKGTVNANAGFVNSNTSAPTMGTTAITYTQFSGAAGVIAVPGGGTGNTTFTAYSVITAGTTATGTFQNISGVGSSGNVLTSNGAAALPTWQAPAASGLSQAQALALTLGS